MDRFVAFIWKADRPGRVRQVADWSAELRARNPNWSTVHDSDGMLVLALPDSRGVLPACMLPPSLGVVIGRVFATGREGRGPLKEFSPDAAEPISASRGDELIRNYWGSYVGLLREPGSDAIHLVRDPCGASACYRCQAKGVTLTCSFVDDIADLSGLCLSVDWDAIRAFLVSNYIINARTGLRELSELMPGQRMTWRPDAPIETAWVWNPVELAARPNRQSFESACGQFRAIAQSCANGWAQGSGSILVRMSGGLDSSIVAGLMRRTSTANMIGVHFVGRGYEAYELNLARKTAEHLGIPLVEQAFERSVIGFRRAASGPRLARPTKQILGAYADEKLRDVCDATGSQTVVSGHGGDAIFLQRSIAGDALVDHVLANGPTPALASLAYDAAMLLETSVWRVAGDAVSKALGFNRWDPGSAMKQGRATAIENFASEAFLKFSPASFTSQWLDEAQRLAPCKAEQLRNIVALRNYHGVAGHAATRRSINPLISQPLVELSLQTPSYLFNAGGLDRALARKAFADLIPEAVARRHHKGFVNHSAIASVVEDLDYIRGLVLDGRCMDGGLLDRKKTEALLSAERLLEGKSLASVMDLIAVESWLMPWLGS